VFSSIRGRPRKPYLKQGPETLFRLSYKRFVSSRVFERIQVFTARSHQIVDFTTKIVSYVGLGSLLSRQGRDTGLCMRLRSFLHLCCFSRSFFFFFWVFFSPSFVQNAVKTFQMIFQYAGEDIARHVCAMGTTTSLRN
jgi:hypothetical protein